MPVRYQPILLPNRAQVAINITPQSDFDNIESICKANNKQKPSCIDFNDVYRSCSQTFTITFSTSLGCDYRCWFMTKKERFADSQSTELAISIRKIVKHSKNKLYIDMNILAPPKPIIVSTVWNSRYIIVYWTIDEPTFVDYFSVFVNGSGVLLQDKRARSFNYTRNIHPNRQ